MFTPTVLIVDDHEDGRDMLAEFFRVHAYATIAVSEPETALMCCQEFEPAIVLVDLSLPTLAAACQLIRTIKHVQPHAVPYIVGLNGWGFVQHAAAALAAGCSVVMAKPLDLSALLAAVKFGIAARARADYEIGPGSRFEMSSAVRSSIQMDDRLS